jgi:2-keto-4-pentenoate hydratase/2-oxohepta-3-ene-1,7-dioic acid hydratase in catechol pathway
MKSVKFESSGALVPVGKILCIGRNYIEHAQEMKADVPGEPVVFLKPTSALIQTGEDIVIPPFSGDVHHEVELVICLGTGGKNIPLENAYRHVRGYGVGLDMTLRDVQSDAKKKGLPWTISKGFDTSAPVSVFVERERVGDPHGLDLQLKVNGQVRQKTNTGKMIFRIDRLISFLSSVFTLEPGDLIFTGTPEGVGPVHSGDLLEAELQSVATLRVGVR